MGVPRLPSSDKCIATINRSPAIGRPEEKLRIVVGYRAGRWVAEVRVYRYIRNSAARGADAEYYWRPTTDKVHVRDSEFPAVIKALQEAAEFVADLERSGGGKPRGRAKEMPGAL